jgi:diacylglycerol diphosphate phosphatase / phosphatidate phosphatase
MVLPLLRRGGYEVPSGPSRKRHLGWSIFLDVLVILSLLILSLAFYLFIMPTPTYFRLNDPALLYPVAPVHVSSPLVAILSFVGPVCVILILNLLFWWNSWDLYAGIMGVLLAYTLAIFFTGLLWVVMGGLRPFFLSKCRINPANLVSGQLYYTSSQICSNHNSFTPDDFHGFPSGHGSSAWAGFLFLAFWLNGKVKAFSRGGHVWKSLIFVIPLSSAIWLSLKRLADYSHNEYQMFWGIILGLLSAMFAYGLMYVQGFWFGFGEEAHIPAIQRERELID